jgi:ArsR family transcriptional regulator
MKRTKETEVDLELFFRALADRTRLRLINLIGDDEVCVCFLVEIIRVNQPKISRHLAYLRRAGIVSARREGKWMHYRLRIPPNPYAATALKEVRTWLANDKNIRADRQRLVKVCCSPNPPAPLREAPKPLRIISDNPTA